MGIVNINFLKRTTHFSQVYYYIYNIPFCRLIYTIPNQIDCYYQIKTLYLKSHFIDGEKVYSATGTN